MNGEAHGHEPQLDKGHPGFLKQSQNSMDLGSALQWTRDPDEERRQSNALASTAEVVEEDTFVSHHTLNRH